MIAANIKRMRAKPLSCPFCGGEPKIIRYSPVKPELPLPWFAVTCRRKNTCSAWPSVSGDTRDEAVANWNRRDATSELQSSELMLRQILAVVLKRIGGSAFVDVLGPEERDAKILIIRRSGFALAEVCVGR